MLCDTYLHGLKGLMDIFIGLFTSNIWLDAYPVTSGTGKQTKEAADMKNMDLLMG